MAERIERTPTQARQAIRTGRVIVVLGVSLALGLLAMFILLAYFYTTHSPPVQ